MFLRALMMFFRTSLQVHSWCLPLILGFDPSIQHQQSAIWYWYQLNFSRFLPDMFARWDLKKSENITYNFNVRNGFNDINSLVEGFIFTNFNSIARGNSQLQNSLVTSHRLNYSKYNLYNFTTILEIFRTQPQKIQW
jgi:hypothetical protein